jgi:REP element-mobilizing transposase RayT
MGRKSGPQEHHRRSIRLAGHDYSQPGAYLVTMVTRGRESLFGEVEAGEVRLSEAGRIVWEVWNALPGRYPQITLGAAVVMPNHFHGILVITDTVVGAVPVGAVPVRAVHEPPQRLRRRMTLQLVVGYLKVNSAKRINAFLRTAGTPVWQRDCYEHIIRNDGEHERIHRYIEANPANWMNDEENPRRTV